MAFSSESLDIDQQLKIADDIRSSDSARFNEILSKLKSVKTLSIKQQNYLNYLLAYQLIYAGKFKESIPILKKIIHSNASIELKFRANSSIVNIFAISQNWTEGLIHLSKNFEILEQIENKEIQQNGLIVAVIFYNLIGQYELGLQYAQKVQSETKNDRTLCFANHLILEAKFKTKQLDENNKNIELGIKSCEKTNEIIVSSLIRTYLATLYINKNNTTRALNLLLQSLTGVENTNYAPILAKYYSLLAKAYFLENKPIESAAYAHKTLLKAQGAGNSEPLILAHSLLYKIELQNSNSPKALEHYIKYAEADKAHLEGEKAKYLAFQLAEHKALEQKSKIDLLSKQNDLLTAEQKLARANAENTRLIIVVLIFTSSVLMFWGFRLLKAHKRIKELAEYDGLTNIFNRGHFTQVANNALKYCQSAGQELSLIVFDLDHFKKINDSFGHACGDWALKKTVEVCKSKGRQNDIFARLGGEEFCILLTSCDIKSAALRAEACRKAIAEIITTDSGFEFTITASFGVTDVKTSGFELEKLLADADSAAYSSKYAGRNQVTVVQTESSADVTTQDNSLGNALDNTRVPF